MPFETRPRLDSINLSSSGPPILGVGELVRGVSKSELLYVKESLLIIHLLPNLVAMSLSSRIRRFTVSG